MVALEWALLLAAITSVSAFSEPLSFESPLLPAHSSDWEVSGAAAPLKKYVRLTPPIANRMGAVFAHTQLTDSSFTIEARFRVSGAVSNQNQGMAIWLSEAEGKSFILGSFFGVDSSFRGIVVYLNSSTKTIGGLVSDRSFDLTHDIAKPGGSCTADFINKDMRIQVKASNKKLKVSIAEEEAAFEACFDVRPS